MNTGKRMHTHIHAHSHTWSPAREDTHKSCWWIHWFLKASLLPPLFLWLLIHRSKRELSSAFKSWLLAAVSSCAKDVLYSCSLYILKYILKLELGMNIIIIMSIWFISSKNYILNSLKFPNHLSPVWWCNGSVNVGVGPTAYWELGNSRLTCWRMLVLFFMSTVLLWILYILACEIEEQCKRASQVSSAPL